MQAQSDCHKTLLNCSKMITSHMHDQTEYEYNAFKRNFLVLNFKTVDKSHYLKENEM